MRHSDGRFITSEVCSRRMMASKWGSQQSHWFIVNGMMHCVAECCRGSGLRRSYVKFLLYANRIAKSELDAECNKQEFEIKEHKTTSIVACFAWRPLAIA